MTILPSSEHWDFSMGSQKTLFRGDSIENYHSTTGEIEVTGNNSGYLESESGNITIHASNSGDIASKKGKIKIYGNNTGLVRGESETVEVYGRNEGRIDTLSGSISVLGNKGIIQTRTGRIKIDYICIDIVKKGLIQSNMEEIPSSITQILTRKGKQEKGSKESYKVTINGVVFDCKNKKVSFKTGNENNVFDMKQEKVDLGNKSLTYEVIDIDEGMLIVVEYGGQSISIGETEVIVENGKLEGGVKSEEGSEEDIKKFIV